MHYVGGVHVKQASKYLIHEVLIVISLQLLLGVYQVVQVRLHEVRDDVDVIIVGL